nr:Chain B, Archaeal ribosomal stalk protein aP1 [Aeropyrum pernix K1]
KKKKKKEEEVDLSGLSGMFGF